MLPISLKKPYALFYNDFLYVLTIAKAQRVSEHYFREKIADLPDNPAAEILRYARGREGVISMAQGEGSMPTPDFIVDAAHKAMAEGKTFYGPVLGQPAIRETISTYYKDIYNVDLEPSRIFMTGSGTTAMHLALTSILGKGDEVVAVTPIWKNLLGAVELAEAKTTQVSLDYNEAKGWTLDLEKLKGACSEKTKALLIVTPSNPTGWTMSDAEVIDLLNFARENEIWIISDEVYGRLVYGKDHAPSFLEHAGPDDLLMTVNSFSKAWAMTGWRLGWLVGPQFAENIIRDIALYDNMGPPTFTQFGGIEAIKHGDAFIKEQLTLWQKNRDRIAEVLGAHPNIHMSTPDSSFYAFFRVDGEPDCVAFAKRLIEEVGLSVTPGCAFGKSCKGWIRMCFAVSEEKLEQALERFLKAIDKAEEAA